MHIKLYTALALTLLLLNACAPGATPTPAKKSGTIRVAFPTTADTGDVPSLMAEELLQAQGYTVQPIFFASPDVEVAAMAKGDADISNGSTRTHWAAAQQGADIVTLSEQVADVWTLVTRPELKSCSDLNGKNVGVNSAGSITNALFLAYVKENCATIHPNVLFVSGSDDRAAALQAGTLDGTLLEQSDILALDKSAPGKYPALINFATALPKLKVDAVFATRTFAQAHPDMVRDYLRALLTVHRNMREKPQLLYDALTKYVAMDAATAKEVGDAYLARGVWDVNGGLTNDDVAYSLKFFVDSGSIPPGLDPAKITDVSYLDDVLKELGRK